jgi:hypothetical protein
MSAREIQSYRAICTEAQTEAAESLVHSSRIAPRSDSNLPGVSPVNQRRASGAPPKIAATKVDAWRESNHVPGIDVPNRETPTEKTRSSGRRTMRVRACRSRTSAT